MDAELRIDAAPFRDPRYAPRRLEVERRADGSVVLTNPTPYSQRFQTALDALAHWREAAPDRVWLAERAGAGWRTLTYGEAYHAVVHLAGGLVARGLTGARPILILAHNGIDHALLMYAAMSQGTPVAPVSPQYGLAGANLARLAHACEALRPAAVFTEDAELFATGLSAEALAGLPVIAARNARPGHIALAELYGSPAAPAARPGDHAKYLLTSGSTGLPKAVIVTHAGLALNSAQIVACFEDDEPPVMVNSAPWSHSLGANSILHMVATRGGTLYIDAGQPTAARFSETVRNLREISPTYHNMVPAGWMLLVEELEKDEALARTFFARLRLMQYGGASLGQDVSDRIQAVAVRTVGQRISFASGYGATETGPTACTVHWPNARMGLIGLPVPGTSVKLAPAAAGKLEFRVKGPQVTPGYLGRPELSAQAFDDEGFYMLGDAARFADPDDPAAGLVFDGRVSENFKLASGTFVTVGEVRIAALSAVGGAVSDAVVCGEGQAALGLMFYPDPRRPRGEAEAAVRAGLAAYNASVKGAAGRIARALVLPDGPDAAAGEITDKGYVAQALARTRRADALSRLFADPPPPDVMVFD